MPAEPRSSRDHRGSRSPSRTALPPGDLIEGHDDEPRLAAVLVAITDRRAEPGLILTLRREDMRTHAGQVMHFPAAGSTRAKTPRAAALREGA